MGFRSRKTDISHAQSDHEAGHTHTMGDKMGVLVSALCALHCAALPLLVSLPSLAGHWMGDSRLEYFFVGSAVLFAVYAGINSLKKRFYSISLLFAAGILILLCGLLFDESIGVYFSISGGVLLIFSHLKNQKACAYKTHDSETDFFHLPAIKGSKM